MKILRMIHLRYLLTNLTPSGITGGVFVEIMVQRLYSKSLHNSLSLDFFSRHAASSLLTVYAAVSFEMRRGFISISQHDAALSASEKRHHAAGDLAGFHTHLKEAALFLSGGVTNVPVKHHPTFNLTQTS